MANSKWQTIPNDRTSIRKCAAPGICCVWSKCVNEQRDWEGVYSWRRSVRYVYNTRNTYIQQAIKMFPHKIWLNVWLYNTFSTNLTRLLVPLVNPFIWCFVRIRTPVFFNFIGPVRDESWSATVITWPWKKTENKIMQAQLDGLICVTPAPLSLILIYQHEVFTAKEHIQNLILIKTGIWNWYCITLNSNNHISYKKYEISTCSLTNQTHTHKSVPKKKNQQQKQCKRRNKTKVSWCFEPSQPQRITSGLNKNFTISKSYCKHRKLLKG